ncbi:uncharacterized protein B0I36DRAFT_352181 [Microdochium trichocladiopsis]|uniref:Maltose/galactoside acetyltransferase domain-containing protein n=1 Tax=Microdochium trichocladiopsis TaxID=1682393 RepID=A0A9P8Y1E8_9PEZI|nr:uncharacterized protein B0I36DRAFT_352181 [Microdochium trichocladiopsis]KAH7026296.1 hypothetical protein B0I36DRAFT_352181 [Microdochium trichocladiopsis]
MTAFTALNGGDSRSSATHKGSPPHHPENDEQRSGARMDSSYLRHNQGSPDGRHNQYIHNRDSGFDSPVKRKRSTSPEPARHADNYRRSDGRAEARTVHFASAERQEEAREDDRGRYQKSWSSREAEDQRIQNERDVEPTSAGAARHDDRDRDPTQEGDTIHVEDPDDPVSSPEDDDSMMPFGDKNEQQRNDATGQSNPSKRKRNFSHRTKTGCFTCNNCFRGGFICTGYHPNGNRDFKAEVKTATVPLESKDPSYVPPGAYGMPQQQQPTYTPHQPAKRNSLPGYRGPTIQTDFPSNRPAPVLDERPPATIPTTSVTSPNGKMSTLSAFAQAANAYATPTSAISTSSTLKTPSSAVAPSPSSEFPRVTGLQDVARSGPKTPHPDTPRPDAPFSSTLPRLNALSPNGHLAATSNAYVPSPLAMTHTMQARPRTQKEEMLAGLRYSPMDEELRLERQRCGTACWRFNNSINPLAGVSNLERMRLFGDILDPKENINLAVHQVSPVTSRGRMGVDVVVEGPFTCDYGYNIRLGNNVFIGRNCTILDPCEVSIGNNCYLGPNVSIYGATLSTDPSQRHGSRSTQTGKRIFIDDDVWIGGGVTILPGRRIGRGATVGAGSVVTKVRSSRA